MVFSVNFTNGSALVCNSIWILGLLVLFIWHISSQSENITAYFQFKVCIQIKYYIVNVLVIDAWKPVKTWVNGVTVMRNHKNVMNISQVIKLLLGVTCWCLLSNSESELCMCDFVVILFQSGYQLGVGLYVVWTLSGSTSTLEPEIFVLVLRVVMFDTFDVQEELVCSYSTFHSADECIILWTTFECKLLLECWRQFQFWLFRCNILECFNRRLHDIICSYK